MSTQLSRFEDEFEPTPAEFTRTGVKGDRHSRRSGADSQAARVSASESAEVAPGSWGSFLSQLVDRLLSWLSDLFN